MCSGLLHIERSTVISCSVSLQIIMASKIEVQVENKKMHGLNLQRKVSVLNNIDSTSCFLCSQGKPEGNNIQKSVRTVTCT